MQNTLKLPQSLSCPTFYPRWRSRSRNHAGAHFGGWPIIIRSSFFSRGCGGWGFLRDTRTLSARTRGRIPRQGPDTAFRPSRKNPLDRISLVRYICVCYIIQAIMPSGSLKTHAGSSLGVAGPTAGQQPPGLSVASPGDFRGFPGISLKSPGDFPGIRGDSVR